MRLLELKSTLILVPALDVAYRKGGFLFAFALEGEVLETPAVAIGQVYFALVDFKLYGYVEFGLFRNFQRFQRFFHLCRVFGRDSDVRRHAA